MSITGHRDNRHAPGVVADLTNARGHFQATHVRQRQVRKDQSIAALAQQTHRIGARAHRIAVAVLQCARGNEREREVTDKREYMYIYICVCMLCV